MAPAPTQPLTKLDGLANRTPSGRRSTAADLLQEKYNCKVIGTPCCLAPLLVIYITACPCAAVLSKPTMPPPTTSTAPPTGPLHHLTRIAGNPRV